MLEGHTALIPEKRIEKDNRNLKSHCEANNKLFIQNGENDSEFYDSVFEVNQSDIYSTRNALLRNVTNDFDQFYIKKDICCAKSDDMSMKKSFPDMHKIERQTYQKIYARSR